MSDTDGVTVKRSSNRARTAIDYDALHNGSSAPLKNPDDPRLHPYIEIIVNQSFPFVKDNLRRVRPQHVTGDFLEGEHSTWTEPFVIPAKWNPAPWHGGTAAAGSPDSLPNKDRDALGMRIPAGLSVRRVAELTDWNRQVPVFEVVNQEGEKWPFGKLVKYFENPSREVIYNCISYEVTGTPLGDMISRPLAVRDVDLVDRVWKHAPPTNPKVSVGKYILMSVRDSYTDFHVDFAGSSVFYHIYEGQKTFLAIPPTAKSLQAYEKWCKSPEQQSTFFPTLVPDMPCMLLHLHKGDTMFIPSGWIHAVYTPVDTFVLGGNFLTKKYYESQFKINHIEAVTHCHKDHRFPKFQEAMWCTMYNYIENDQMPEQVERAILTSVFGRAPESSPPRNPEAYTTAELEGLPALLNFLYRNVMIVIGCTTKSHKGTNLKKHTVEKVRKAIPAPMSRNPLQYIKYFARWCIWMRACYDIVPGGERLPDWARVEWQPQSTNGRRRSSTILPDPNSSNGELCNHVLAGDSKDSTSSSRMGLEKFDYFPQSRSKSKSETNDDHPRPSKKTNTRRNPQSALTDPSPEGAAKVYTLSDGSIYVRKASKLGPPRIGCESCRQKKTGCKHKEEIRRNGWIDDDSDLEDSGGTTTGAKEEDAVDLRMADVEDTELSDYTPPPTKATTSRQKTLTPAEQEAGAAEDVNTPTGPKINGAPMGYKGRKPSCDECKILKVRTFINSGC